MNLSNIFYYLGKLNLLIIFFSVLNLLYCFYFDFNINLEIYFICLIISGFLYFLSFKIKLNLENFRSKDIILFSILGWIILSFIMCLPFWVGGYGNFFNSYFEALSGLSSYGASILLGNLNLLDSPILLWRSSTQLVGAIYFVITIVLVLGNRDLNLYPIKFITQKKDSVYFSVNFENIFNNTIYAFAILFLISLFFLNFTELRILEKFTLAFAIISSGGFFISELFLTESDKIIISFLLIFSSLNIFLILGLFKINNTYTFYEDRYFLLSFLFFLIILIFFGNNINLSNTIIYLASAISNSGINFVNYHNSNITFILLSASFFGGCLISSTSGFKLSRILIIFNKIYSELLKLLTPSSIINSTIFKSKEKITSRDFYSSSLLLFFYILMFVTFSFILTLENVKFEDSFLISVLLTFNTLPSTLYLSEAVDFSKFSDLTLFFSSIMLLLSKVTPLSVIALIKYTFIK